MHTIALGEERFGFITTAMSSVKNVKQSTTNIECQHHKNRILGQHVSHTFSCLIHNIICAVYVFQKNLLLCVVLETGGVAQATKGKVPIDMFYVDQAKAALLQMESHDVLTHCKRR